MEEEPPTPPTPAQPTSPFWLPSHRHRFRPTSALVFNTGFFVLLLSISAIAFLALLTPSFLSFTHHVFRPTSIKRGWDSLNLLLVAFAVLCGFLGRKDAEDQPSIDDGHKSRETTPRLSRSEQNYTNWYPDGYQGNMMQLRRSFNSYPDLRQEFLWENDRRPRYFDDSYVGNYNSPRLTRSAESLRSRKVDDGEQQNGSDVKNLERGGLGKHTSEDSAPTPVESIPLSPPTLTPVSLQPPTPDLSVGAKDSRQEYQRIRRRVRRRRKLAAKEAQSPADQAEVLAEVEEQDSEEESVKRSPKKRGGITKEIISSIYHQSKRKRKNQKRGSHENLEDFIHTPNPKSSIPPPPPPPPPPSIFHNLFSSKKGKSGKKSSSAPPPPPPPPPRRRSSTSHSIANTSKARTIFTPAASPPPPPPPPPPFKFRPWKFAVEGDYVKISSSSPKSGAGDSDSDSSTPGNRQPAVSCPSPDVNDKADDFIAMFRAKLKLEKMDSWKQKQESGIGFSPLGPDSSPSRPALPQVLNPHN